RILLLDHRVVHDLGQRGHRADLEAVLPRPDASQFSDALEIDQCLRALDAILQPVEAVETAGEDPRFRSVAAEQRLRVFDRRGLIQLERRHHVANYGHSFLPWAGLKSGPYNHVGPTTM